MKNRIQLFYNFLYLNLPKIYHYLFLYPINRLLFSEFGVKSKIIKPIFITPRWIKIKNNVSIRNGARVEGVYKYLDKEFIPLIVIEDYVSIEQNIHITCANSVIISKNTAIAANVTITDIDHPYEDINFPPEKQNIRVGKVFIGEDCKIYNNVVILPNAIIGKHTVVGANSVVIGKEYPDYSILVGSPAKIIKRYSFEKQEWLKTDKEGNFLNL
jgi:acetyltransferase-like isoleucine patch superfamily enzyme